MRKLKLWTVGCGVLLGLLPLLAEAQQPKPADDPWRPLAFMLGEWTASGSKEQAAATGGLSFKLELGGKIMVRRNFAEYPAQEAGKPPIKHEDLLIVYPSPADSQYAAIYFDNEGHVINYVVSFDEQKSTVRMESQGPEQAPRFRLDYVLNLDSTLNVVFSIARPGDAFKVYTTGVARRQP